LGYAGQVTIERTAEELLLEFERTGMPEPFEEIVRRYSGMVYHVCFRITKDRHDAEDAVQGVFAALAVGRKKESGDVRAMGPWLRQVARRTSLDIRRGKKRRQRRETLCACDGSAPTEESKPAKSGGMDAEDLKVLVKEELERMPVKYRLPLVLHYFGGMSQEEMAKELGCRPGTLRVRLHRGRQMLAQRLGKRGAAGVSVVVLAVAVTRAVQSSITQSLALHMASGYTAAGVMQASSGSMPVTAVVQGVAVSKVKVACAVVLIGACVVRAGAEVYQYIVPMQMRTWNPMNRLVQPLMDSFELPFRVDATPVKKTEGKKTEVANSAGWAGVKAVEPTIAPVMNRVVGGEVLPVRRSVGPVALVRTEGFVHGGGGTGMLAERLPGGVQGSWSAHTGSNVMGWTGGAGGVGRTSRVGTGNVAATPVVASSGPPVVTPSPVVNPPVGTAGNVPPVVTTPGTTQVANGTTGTSVPAGSGQGNAPAPGPIVIDPVPVVVASASPNGWTTTLSNQTTEVSNPSTDSYSTMPSVMAVNDSVQSMGPLLMSVANLTPSTPSNQTYHVTRTGLSGKGVVTATILDNSGIVKALADTTSPAVLDLSKVEEVINSVNNPPNGVNGWFVGPHAKLMLPAVMVAAGTNSYSWGESAGDTTPDLVNSVRFTLHDVATAGEVEMALLSPDWPGVPALPGGDRVVGLWSFDSNALAAGGIDLLVRYDAAEAIALAGSDLDVQLLDYDQGWNLVDAGDLDVTDHTIGGHGGDLTYFAVTVSMQRASHLSQAFTIVTPEPGCFAVGMVGIGLLLTRRNRKM
jgi:RNA polymerase sigma factor (sigma-70 family)